MQHKHRAKWKKVGSVDWRAIRDTWLEHIPQIPSPGAKPETSVDELHDLKANADLLKNGSTLPHVNGLLEIVLWESIFLFYKADHVVRFSQRNIDAGLVSWSLLDAYHSAFLGARAIVDLLGIVLARPFGSYVMLDLFPEGGFERQGKKNVLESGVIRVWSLPQSEFHVFVWGLLLRTVRTRGKNVIGTDLVNELEILDILSASSLRNRYLYVPSFWPLDDLTRPILNIPELPRVLDLDGPKTGDPSSDCMNLLRIAFVIRRIGLTLFRELSTRVPAVAKQLEYLESEEHSQQNRRYTKYIGGA